ncbi:uncharacterized zinc finger protein CG2678-like [Chrysoperla carnea]|uniref:uncharacterized zinc finger protein CG2678-like n=1 Tax=Chrysoperla carnea TaxID=189513 RepID=UPI001D085B8B|nr:uncharacterized zinc finger protein CG2678-like [Chrysoperla carnea]
MLTTCTTICIEVNDGLPTQICTMCSSKIQQSFSFKQESENCDRILRQVLLQDNYQDDNNVNNIKYELDDMKDEPEQPDGSVDDDYLDDSNQGNTDSNHANTDDSDELDDNDDDKNDLKTDTDDLEFPPIHVVDTNHTNKKDSAWQKALQLGPEKCDPTTKTCKICNKVLYNVHSLVRHVETHDENRKYAIVCTICNKGFYEKQHIKNHMLRHKGAARYKCKECKKPFYELNALRVHVKRKHSTHTIKCSQCTEVFILEQDLEIHQRSVHECKQYECKQCGKTFNYRYRLREHQVMHTKERTYHCTATKDCLKSFKSKQVLHLHYKRCHSGQKKREVCNVCGKSVINLKSVKNGCTFSNKHRKWKTPFQL